MSQKLREKRSLVELARKFGQEPAPKLLEEIAELEIEEAEFLKRQAELRERISVDLTEIFGKVTTHELVQPSPEPPAETSAEPTITLTEAQADQQLEIKLPISTVDAVSEYLKNSVRESTLVNPEPVLARPGKNLEAEVKRLEQWVSRIAATGPGSGEVWFKFLNDVNRDTLAPGSDNWVLEYDAATKKVQFTTNVGAIDTLRFTTSQVSTVRVPGMMNWNPGEDCLDITHGDGSTLQAGLEHHIRVYNNTAAPLPNGYLVYFNNGAVYDGDEVPTAGLYIANGTCRPLDVIGVMTNTVSSNGVGRATTFGKVRNIDTTGTEFGETWLAGDILWASTTTSGHLTKVQPTAPNDAIKIGQILRASVTSGVILVNPVVFPRLHYGTFSSTIDQFASSNNTAVATTFNTTGPSLGFHIHSSVSSRIVAEYSGLYNFQFSLQFVSASASLQNIWIWYRKNGVDVSNTATKISVQSNGGYLAPAWNFIESLTPGQYFELMWATDGSGSVKMDAPNSTAFCPAIPSALLSVSQVNI
jgi:hypothetical protein